MSTHLPLFRLVLLLVALSAFRAQAAPTYSKDWTLDPSDTFGTSPESVTNAYIRHETFAPFVQYWQPTSPNSWAEVIYKFDIPFEVLNASLEINVNAYNGTDGGPNFDSEAQSFAQVSTDGVNYTTVMQGGYPGHQPDWVLSSDYGDISALVVGADTIFIRSRMFMSTEYSGFASAQFLRGAPGGVYNLAAIGVPEPSSVAMILTAGICLGAYVLRPGRKPK